MQVRADLHTHSTASDGQYAPAELVQLAKKRAVQVLALTDHDTIAGLEEAICAGEEMDLQVLRGIELSAKENRGLHILGYCFDCETPALLDLCEKLREGREERKYRLIDFLREKGAILSLDEVEEIAGGDIIARPHFAQALVRRGYVATVREAFDRYLDTEEYQRIERFKPSACACVEAICGAGGKAALAHPYQLKLSDERVETIVKELAGCGLAAIECYYPEHTPAQTKFYLHLAEKYGLHVTGGSDFHGERIKPDTAIATLPLHLDWLL